MTFLLSLLLCFPTRDGYETSESEILDFIRTARSALRLFCYISLFYFLHLSFTHTAERDKRACDNAKSRAFVTNFSLMFLLFF